MMAGQTISYELIDGDRHRHKGGLTHSHRHYGPHTHEPAPHSHNDDHHHGGHGHSHGLVDASIKRSREGVRAVGLSLAVLALAAGAQLAIFIASGSIALLADLIHNFGDASTAIPLGAAFLLRLARAERWAGLFVVATIFVSACVAGVEAISRLIHPQTPTHLLALAAAGVIGFGGNWIAAQIRTRAGNRLDSPALIADGNHARADSYVSLAVVATAIVVAPGRRSADRPGDRGGHPQDHPGLVADCARGRPSPLTRRLRIWIGVQHPARCGLKLLA